MSFTFPSNPLHTLYYFIVSLAFLSSSTHQLCKPEERTALLQFKRHFDIKSSSFDGVLCDPRTLSWKDDDDECCAWEGVICDDTTGNIIQLYLSFSCLYGTIPANSSLFSLIHLEYLNLGGNYFNNSQISPKFENLRNLTLLYLYNSEFSGDVPNEILQLQKLKELALSGNNRLTVNLSNLNTTEIESLVLDGICFSSDIPNSIGQFKSLRYLDFSDCCLHGTIPANSSLFTLIHLEGLYLSGNHFNNSQISPKFGNLRNLTELYLDYSEFSGDVPNEILQLQKLKELDLRGNNRLTGNLSNLNTTEIEYLALSGICFSSDIPNSIGKFKSLRYLDLGDCCLYGAISANSSLFSLIHLEYLNLGGNYFNNSQISPKLGNLRNLTNLYLGDSEFSGDVPNEILQLQKLKTLSLYGNNRLTGNLSNLNTTEIEELILDGICLSSDIPNSIGQFKSLRYIYLSDCCLHGTIPQSLTNLQNLVQLYLSNNYLNGTIPTSLGNLTQLIGLNLGNNSLSGEIPSSFSKFHFLKSLDLSNNYMNGTIPASLGNLTQLSYLHFGNNSLSGKIPSSYSKFPFLKSLDLSHNSLSGQPLTCMFLNHSLEYLDLSDNNFTGEIPAFFNESTTNLEVLYLRQNNFHGTIPQSIGFANNLKILDLNSNSLQGVLPRSLKNCTSLEVLNLGGNMLMDGFPFWLGDLTLLKVLVLRDNKFRGTMKGMLPTFFTNLHIIDMSHNDLTGNLPSEYFEKWNSMAIVDEKAPGIGYMQIGGGYYSVTIVNKGLSLSYKKILATLKVIDFSRNRFYGYIPLSLGSLKGIQVLNLSGNSLTGIIPLSIGNLTNLESLDLSNNNLSGKIPYEISKLTFLAFFNVSQNNLSGAIPGGGQLNTFPNASYEANPNLCGIPLSKLCTIPSSPKVAKNKTHHYQFEIDGFGWEIVLIGYTCGMMLGVAIGCCILRNKEEWIMGIFRLKIHQSRKRSNKK